MLVVETSGALLTRQGEPADRNPVPARHSMPTNVVLATSRIIFRVDEPIFSFSGNQYRETSRETPNFTRNVGIGFARRRH